MTLQTMGAIAVVEFMLTLYFLTSGQYFFGWFEDNGPEDQCQF